MFMKNKNMIRVSSLPVVCDLQASLL